MRLFEKIHIKLKTGKSKQICLFDIPVFQSNIINNQDGISKKHYYLPFLKKTGNYADNEGNNPVFYLKVNNTATDVSLNSIMSNISGYRKLVEVQA